MKTLLFSFLFLVFPFTCLFSQNNTCQIECKKLDSLNSLLNNRENELKLLRQKNEALESDTIFNRIGSFNMDANQLLHTIQTQIIKDNYKNDTLFEFEPIGTYGLSFIRKTKFDPGFFDPLYERKVAIDVKIIPDDVDMQKSNLFILGYHHYYRRFDNSSSFKVYEKDKQQDFKSTMIKELLNLIENGQ